ncbi:hypothetical protein JCM31826_10600 [Thermaurantimonas aggregans]|uniref:Uncharacterized protein n=1 Tax=Thermaurantimonas aggregans TaxID=2173829 RepID=A0A401XKP7_9FLAO|nr:hypothetical protein [Thermaurantimonas aggregans]MCX8147916.1 hypothetical protein [Thermaurantimonas aggregans]GCD77578.1 hypothetical protein JCM31826_10600 [Thermaurantimonas aggregans]
MDSKKLELATLITGSIAILLAIYFGFIAASALSSSKIINYIFALAFFVFIAYNYIKSTEYEKIKKQLIDEISELNNRIESLTADLNKKTAEIENLNADLSDRDKKIAEVENENKKLQQKVENLEEKIQELSKRIDNPTV